MDSIQPMSIRLDTGSEVVLDFLCTIPKVVCDIGGHTITLHVPWIIQCLKYDIILAIDWL